MIPNKQEEGIIKSQTFPRQLNFAFPYVLNLPFEGRNDIRCTLWKTNSENDPFSSLIYRLTMVDFSIVMLVVM